MKLRNLLFGTMIACAFVACSNDDDPTPDKGQPEGTAKTVLEIRSNAALETKAGADEGINALTMVVFNGDNVEAVSGTAGKAKVSVKQEGISAGVKSVIVLANYTGADITTADTKATVFGKYVNFVAANAIAETDGHLTMNSQLYSNINVIADAYNLFGYDEAPYSDNTYNLIEGGETGGVKLYRNVAKIVLNKVALTEKLKADQNQYPNAQLALTKAFILNAKGQSMATGQNGAKWGATQVATEHEGFAWYNGVAPETSWAQNNKFAYATAATANADLSKDISGNLIVTKDQSQTISGISFYTYENYSSEVEVEKDIKTLFVLQGDFSYTGLVNNKEERINNPSRYYTLAVGRTGMANGIDLSQLNDFAGLTRDGVVDNKAFDVLRNLQYNITIGINSIGYKTPVGGGGDDAVLDVKCQVVPFGQVDQSVEI